MYGMWSDVKQNIYNLIFGNMYVTEKENYS